MDGVRTVTDTEGWGSTFGADGGWDDGVPDGVADGVSDGEAGGWRIPWPVADMAPGLMLGFVLDSIDRSGLNGHDVVTLIEARARQVAYLQAELLADVAELAHCPPGTADSPPERQASADEGAADELRLGLCLTRRSADDQLALALALTERLPRVWEALGEGRIDLGRARVIVGGTDHVDQTVARSVADRILPQAAHLSTGQIRARVAKLVIEVDPQAARQAVEERHEERRLVRGLNPEGTANLSAYDLPPQRAASIWNRVQHIAAALHRRGDPRDMDQLRADIFMDLLEGHHPDHDGEHQPRPLVDIRLGLDTLIGLNQTPGHIPGWGPVIADIARQTALQQQHGQWRITLTDPDTGATLWNGTTRRRPTATQTRWTQTTQPTCIFPTCRMPATDCDIDHTTDHQHGGPTHTTNLAPLCRHDHTLKHKPGWKLRPTPNGTHQWTTPHGHTYPQPP